MSLDHFLSIAGAQFVLLNPFLMSVYLSEVIRDMSMAQFAKVLLRAGLISGTVFALFAWTGDAVFKQVLNVRFAAFLLFGGLVWLAIGTRFVMSGSTGMASLRGSPAHVAGAVAMPFMIGPGTVSASIFAGSRLGPALGAAAMLVAIAGVVLTLLVLKVAHDRVKRQNEELVERYTDLVGRISALVVGTFAVEMILHGIELWLDSR